MQKGKYKNMGINRSEMSKEANPITHAFNRESYFTRIRFKIDNNLVNVTTKIDTSATYTVIGLENSYIKPFKDKILRSNMRGIAYDAQNGNSLLETSDQRFFVK